MLKKTERVVEFNPVLLAAEPTLVRAGAEPRTAGLSSVSQHSTHNK